MRRRDTPRPGAHAAGLALVEMVLAASITLVLLAAIGGFSAAESRLFAREKDALELRDTARRSLDEIARVLREAGSAPVAGGFDGSADGLSVAAADRVEVQADRHDASGGGAPDGEVDPDSDERSGFHRGTDGVLRATVGRQALPLSPEGAVPRGGLRFRYFDACGGELVPPSGASLASAERARVRRVTIALLLREASGAELAVEATASLRTRPERSCE